MESPNPRLYICLMQNSNSLPFFKYQGTGNDFVMIDNRQGSFELGTERIREICARRTGVGADGLILLQHSDTLDFRMVYFNADGRESTMCGNGGRCIVSFARRLGLIEKEARFEAVDGYHRALLDGDVVTLYMSDVNRVEERYVGYFVDTGSPHYVQVMNQLKGWNVDAQGRRIRYEEFGEEGANVNFVQVIEPDGIRVRTYERGVEAETLSCGTGVTAASLAMHAKGYVRSERIRVETPGGSLVVGFRPLPEGGYDQVFLQGPATFVYSGMLPW